MNHTFLLIPNCIKARIIISKDSLPKKAGKYGRDVKLGIPGAGWKKS